MAESARTFIRPATPRLVQSRWFAFAVACVAASFSAVPATAQEDTADFFKSRCYGCHTIGGGRLQGPDLKNVTQRKDREWLLGFMTDPPGVIASGDPYATKLVEEARNIRMPAIAGMTRERAERLLDLIDEESKKAKSRFEGVKLITRPFTAADADEGRELFLGRKRLENGGTACISCHSMHDLPALGGGRLGPELTRVFDKYKDRKTLGTWLAAGGTATMQPVFKDHPLTPEEIHSLSAYFSASAGESTSDPAPSRVSFLLLGLFVSAALVFGMDAVWKRRFHAVRKPLVESETSPTPENGP
jgi:mono/diheme cytochrome c family protein